MAGNQVYLIKNKILIIWFTFIQIPDYDQIH